MSRYKKNINYDSLSDTTNYIKSNVPQKIMDLNKSNMTSTSYHTWVGDQYDNNNLTYVGWDTSIDGQSNYKYYFTRENMKYISETITKRLENEGYYYIVSDEVIGGVMSDMIKYHTPIIADMYTQYIIPQEKIRDDIKNLNSRVINTIVSSILDEEDAKKWNESLSVWDTVYGDFNRKGLRAHSIIRKKDNDYMKGQFNTNY